MPASPKGTAPDLSAVEWENVREESPDRVIFDTDGDTLIGTFVNREIIHPSDDPDDDFEVLYFRDALFNGEKVDYASTYPGYAMRTAFAEISFGRLVRVQRIKETKVKNQPSAMVDFRIDVAKESSGTNRKS